MNPPSPREPIKIGTSMNNPIGHPQASPASIKSQSSQENPFPRHHPNPIRRQTSNIMRSPSPRKSPVKKGPSKYARKTVKSNEEGSITERKGSSNKDEESDDSEEGNARFHTNSIENISKDGSNLSTTCKDKKNYKDKEGVS